jgi:hypothetical protein
MRTGIALPLWLALCSDYAFQQAESHLSRNAGDMKLAMSSCALALSLWVVSPAASDEHHEASAAAAAVAWLALVDAGSYAESWNAAATRFRQAVTQQQWQSSAARAHTLFGALKSRELQSATFEHTLPGAPDGEYVVVRFATSFANKATAIETVTPMKDNDGTWRVAGYYIK